MINKVKLLLESAVRSPHVQTHTHTHTCKAQSNRRVRDNDDANIKEHKPDDWLEVLPGVRVTVK